jgi:Tfp pilus assembly protein PilW
MRNAPQAPGLAGRASVCQPKRRKAAAGFTLVEMLIAAGLGTLVLTVVAILTLYGSYSFAAIANYTDLDSQSRKTLDALNRELRQGSAVIAIQTNLPVRSLTVTNADQGTSITLSWDSRTQKLVVTETGLPPTTYLTQCSDWNFSLFNRADNVTSNTITFNPASTLATCKIISMTWKCSRPVLVGQRVNTENVQTAQVVLRNQVTN